MSIVFRSEFEKLPSKCATRADMVRITKACGCPLYWKEPLFQAVLATAGLSRQAMCTGPSIAAGNLNNSNSLQRRDSMSKSKIAITCDEFTEYWKR